MVITPLFTLINQIDLAPSRGVLCPPSPGGKQGGWRALPGEMTEGLQTVLEASVGRKMATEGPKEPGGKRQAPCEWRSLPRNFNYHSEAKIRRLAGHNYKVYFLGSSKGRQES